MKTFDGVFPSNITYLFLKFFHSSMTKSFQIPEYHTVRLPGEKCACCGESSDLLSQRFEVSYIEPQGSRQIQHTFSIDCPFCKHCIAHSKKFNSSTKYLGFLPFVITILYVIYVSIASSPDKYAWYYNGILWIELFVCGIVLYFIIGYINAKKAESMVKPNCSNANWAVQIYNGHDGGLIAFDNEKYANEFAQVNDYREI